MITGPNMSGKSAIVTANRFDRVLMAQMGSFVPAKAACTWAWSIKYFTRVGASDNISSGESTFMVEMNETASILNNVIRSKFDFIGRDWAWERAPTMAFLLLGPLPSFCTSINANAKTLFATHYHELNEMADNLCTYQELQCRGQRGW